MTADLHARIKAAVDEARKTAEAATPGPWRTHDDEGIVSVIHGDHEGSGVGYDISWQEMEGRVGEANASHIARFDPSFALRLCDHADDVLARHLPPDQGGNWCVCEWAEEHVHHQFCPDVRALATAWIGDGWDQ